MSIILRDGANASHLAAVDASGNVAVTLAAGAITSNLTQINGVAVSVNNGTTDTGTQRVTLSSDSTGQVKLAAGAATIGALTANQSVNVAQINGATTSTAASGVQKVGVVGNAGAIFDGATGASVPANAVYQGARGTTALPTAVSDGQSVGIMTDKYGRVITAPMAPRDLVGRQVTTIASSNTETTIVTAVASTFNDLTAIQITNASATAVTVTIKDSTAGTTAKIFDLAANGGIVVSWPTPLKQTTINNNWTATLSVNTVTVNINVDFVANK